MFKSIIFLLSMCEHTENNPQFGALANWLVDVGDANVPDRINCFATLAAVKYAGSISFSFRSMPVSNVIAGEIEEYTQADWDLLENGIKTKDGTHVVVPPFLASYMKKFGF